MSTQQSVSIKCNIFSENLYILHVQILFIIKFPYIDCTIFEQEKPNNYFLEPLLYFSHAS